MSLKSFNFVMAVIALLILVMGLSLTRKMGVNDSSWWLAYGCEDYVYNKEFSAPTMRGLPDNCKEYRLEGGYTHG